MDRRFQTRQEYAVAYPRHPSGKSPTPAAEAYPSGAAMIVPPLPAVVSPLPHGFAGLPPIAAMPRPAWPSAPVRVVNPWPSRLFPPHPVVASASSFPSVSPKQQQQSKPTSPRLSPPILSQPYVPISVCHSDRRSASAKLWHYGCLPLHPSPHWFSKRRKRAKCSRYHPTLRNSRQGSKLLAL